MSPAQNGVRPDTDVHMNGAPVNGCVLGHTRRKSTDDAVSVSSLATSSSQARVRARSKVCCFLFFFSNACR